MELNMRSDIMSKAVKRACIIVPVLVIVLLLLGYVLLKGLSTRTLILWGARDRVLHVSGAKILESAMPRAKVVIMDDAGHVPMIERPKESAQAYLSFLGVVT